MSSVSDLTDIVVLELSLRLVSGSWWQVGADSCQGLT